MTAVVFLAIGTPVLGALLVWAAQLHRDAAEWDSVADHHELMAALDPEVAA